MIEAYTIQALREAVAGWRLRADRVALVPTMGNLHDGHLKLVEIAKETADKVVVSLFVNPSQFVEGEDFQSYPRTLAEDMNKLQSAGVDMLFVPENTEVYPQAMATVVDVEDLSTILCGRFRPGHFQGVATVVCKLLNMAQPDVALFGEKDFQQLMVIHRMVADLNIPVEVMGVNIVREADGLAMSSRNAYLIEPERALAPCVYEALCWAQQQLAAGNRNYAQIESAGLQRLQRVGFRVDYFSIRQSGNLWSADGDSDHLVILVAAWLGRARLIDNLRFDV